VPVTARLSKRFYDVFGEEIANAAIQKIAYPSLSNAEIYTHAGALSNGRFWVNWIIPY
jgi:hypothetical protein